MAPLIEALGLLVKRYRYCPSGYYASGDNCYEYSSWYWWGRWVLTAIIILAIVAILVLLGCVSARRRRRRGLAPMYGTGWMGPKYGGPPQQGNPQGYYQPYQPYPQQPYQPPPPKYTPPANYYGGQSEGIQQPPNSYAMHGASSPVPNRSDEPVYEPPPGPPPGK